MAAIICLGVSYPLLAFLTSTVSNVAEIFSLNTLCSLLNIHIIFKNTRSIPHQQNLYVPHKLNSKSVLCFLVANQNSLHFVLFPALIRWTISISANVRSRFFSVTNNMTVSQIHHVRGPEMERRPARGTPYYAAPCVRPTDGCHLPDTSGGYILAPYVKSSVYNYPPLPHTSCAAT